MEAFWCKCSVQILYLQKLIQQHPLTTSVSISIRIVYTQITSPQWSAVECLQLCEERVVFVTNQRMHITDCSLSCFLICVAWEKYCDRERSNLEILTDLHVFSTYENEKVIFWGCCLCICLDSAWMVACIHICSLIAQSTSDWMARACSQQGQEIFLFPTASRVAVGCT
jgi:hypothetical protein